MKKELTIKINIDDQGSININTRAGKFNSIEMLAVVKSAERELVNIINKNVKLTKLK